ncbi:MAG: HDIG domain-containing protein [Treponema sp.]|jgi:putative nucleotidyltransferase with HDIG domain|nr:HDIG domain-containing protein [Treponema sp.]
MKKKAEWFKPDKWRESLFRVFSFFRLRPGPSLAAMGALLVSTLVVTLNMNNSAGAAGDIRDFEAGRVADRDVTAGQFISYVDEEATRLRLEAQERLVPAVFRFSSAAGENVRDEWKLFAAFVNNLSREGASTDTVLLAIQAKYPAFFSRDTLVHYLNDPDRGQFEEYGDMTLNNILEQGIFSINKTELEHYNPDIVELLISSAARTEREWISYNNVITRDTAAAALNHYISVAGLPASFTRIAGNLLAPFIAENVFFSPEDTRQRVAETRNQVEPVVKYIDKGERIIRKGFIITEDDMKELRALNMSLSGSDPRRLIGQILIMILLYGLFVALGDRRILGRSLSNAEIYLIAALAGFYLILAVFVRDFAPGGAEPFPTSIILPTAMVVMLPGILVGPRIALVMAMVLPLGAFLSGSFDTSSYIFALLSGICAACVLWRIERRMDLFRSGLIIAGANCVAAVVILLSRQAGLASYPSMLFGSVFNGIVSGMLVLGLLPPLEQALNAATTFRLVELSDLNAPILKRLFTAAPGTYSHSIMVANLAEAACQDIGANPLLARVGAYYHDIGKMENPGYFVENQTVYNRHDDTPPRLSATVIRSHVKLGIEKARSLNLPREVIDIIAEHHGNSVITWFYNKALKQETTDPSKRTVVNMEDFTYPGTPPRSRESAVVMLADVTEAAVRTLNKPTAVKMEKFIQTLIDSKVEHGQLAESELTFRDLAAIKGAFVRVLAGYYHSRIEYPKLKEINSREAAAPKTANTAVRPAAPKEIPE